MQILLSILVADVGVSEDLVKLPSKKMALKQANLCFDPKEEFSPSLVA